MMRFIFAVASVALITSACQSPAVSGLRSTNPAPLQAASLQGQAVTRISVQEAHDWLADPNAQWLLLDLRTPDEFATGHLANATLMNFYDADFRDRLLTMNRHQPTLIYCRSGNRSGQALAMMRELGFRNVYDIGGGIMAWQNAGYAIER